MKLNKRATLSAAAVLGLGAIVAILGTTAFFKDTKSATNTFTVGNVKIDLLESQYHRVNAGSPTKTSEQNNHIGDTEPTLGGYLWAANTDMQGTADNTPDVANSTWTGVDYFSDAQIEADAATYKEANGYYDTHASNITPGANVRKNAYIKNTGNNEAYVRTRVLIPTSLFAVIDNGPSYWTTTAVDHGDGPIMYSDAVTYYFAHNNTMDGYPTVTRTNEDNEDITYYSFDFTYKHTLAPGAITFWSPWGNIAIDKDATSDDLDNVDSFDVIFEADAIQADGFSDATTAFANFGN